MAESVIEQADAAHDRGNIAAVHALLKAAIEDQKLDSVELLWRYARCHYDLAEETTEKAEKEGFVNTGIQIIQKAQEKDPNHWAVHKWNGILLGSLGEFQSTKDKIANAYKIRDHFLKACELNPKDGTTHHCMGKWCWKVLQIGFLERQAASLIFGSPPTSTYEECEKYLVAADALSRTINNCLLLGDLCYQKSRYGEAKQWYNSAIALEAVTEAQRRQVEDAKKKLAKC